MLEGGSLCPLVCFPPARQTYLCFAGWGAHYPRSPVEGDLGQGTARLWERVVACKWGRHHAGYVIRQYRKRLGREESRSAGPAMPLLSSMRLPSTPRAGVGSRSPVAQPLPNPFLSRAGIEPKRPSSLLPTPATAPCKAPGLEVAGPWHSPWLGKPSSMPQSGSRLEGAETRLMHQSGIRRAPGEASLAVPTVGFACEAVCKCVCTRVIKWRTAHMWWLVLS